MFCLFDILEGEVCGFVKNLVFMIYIIINVDEGFVKCWIFMFDFGVELICNFLGVEMYCEGSYIIYVNGIFFVLICYLKWFVVKFRVMCCKGWILFFVGINLNIYFNVVYIVIDEGCIC